MATHQRVVGIRRTDPTADVSQGVRGNERNQQGPRASNARVRQSQTTRHRCERKHERVHGFRHHRGRGREDAWTCEETSNGTFAGRANDLPPCGTTRTGNHTGSCVHRPPSTSMARACVHEDEDVDDGADQGECKVETRGSADGVEPPRERSATTTGTNGPCENRTMNAMALIGMGLAPFPRVLEHLEPRSRTVRIQTSARRCPRCLPCKVAAFRVRHHRQVPTVRRTEPRYAQRRTVRIVRV
mmetsp:Transcript_7286/g.25854  ORF Transcript_7286/g.25854 Transcript_7286/m.25854 type:complete len:243 (+) Transcript_7286:757-1485(+)